MLLGSPNLFGVSSRGPPSASSVKQRVEALVVHERHRVQEGEEDVVYNEIHLHLFLFAFDAVEASQCVCSDHSYTRPSSDEARIG